MPAKRKVTVYTVQTVAWEYNDEFNVREDGVFLSRGAADANETYLSDPLPVRSFLTRRQAEAHRQAKERERRVGLNPFEYGGQDSDLTSFSSLPARAFTERLQILGVQPPEFDRRGRCLENLWTWWHEQCQHLSADLRNAVWDDVLDQVRFYQVVPMQVDLEG